MKNFLVYSRTPLEGSINLEDAVNIRFLRKGLRFLYFFDATGIIYAIFNKFYLLSFLILLNFMLFNVLLSLEYFEGASHYLLSIKYSINALLVIFGLEIEEFFLKRKKYKLQNFIVAKNSKIALESVIEGLEINFIKSPSCFSKMFNKIKCRFCKAK